MIIDHRFGNASGLSVHRFYALGYRFDRECRHPTAQLARAEPGIVTLPGASPASENRPLRHGDREGRSAEALMLLVLHVCRSAQILPYQVRAFG